MRWLGFSVIHIDSHQQKRSKDEIFFRGLSVSVCPDVSWGEQDPAPKVRSAALTALLALLQAPQLRTWPVPLEAVTQLESKFEGGGWDVFSVFGNRVRIPLEIEICDDIWNPHNSKKNLLFVTARYCLPVLRPCGLSFSDAFELHWTQEDSAEQHIAYWSAGGDHSTVTWHSCHKVHLHGLRGGFKLFFTFTHYLGKCSNLTCAYFSNGLVETTN